MSVIKFLVEFVRCLAEILLSRPSDYEADARIADDFHRRAIEWAKTVRGLEKHIGETDSSRIATAIRAQPHDRSALDRMLAEAREKALRHD